MDDTACFASKPDPLRELSSILSLAVIDLKWYHHLLVTLHQPPNLLKTCYGLIFHLIADLAGHLLSQYLMRRNQLLDLSICWRKDSTLVRVLWCLCAIFLGKLVRCGLSQCSWCSRALISRNTGSSTFQISRQVSSSPLRASLSPSLRSLSSFSSCLVSCETRVDHWSASLSRHEHWCPQLYQSDFSWLMQVLSRYIWWTLCRRAWVTFSWSVQCRSCDEPKQHVHSKESQLSGHPHH